MTGPTPDLLRLNLNESPYPPPASVVAAVAEAAAGLNRYPTDETPLREAVADWVGVSPARILLSAGSAELLALLPFFSGAHRPGDHIVIPEPSFPTYAIIAASLELEVTRVGLTPEGAVDVPAMLAVIRPETRLVCVPTPNNPTGAMLDSGALEALVDGLPPHVMVHLDEAYYEFARAAGGPETLPILSRARCPWLATRSFSKAFGLAGARLGYGIASSDETGARWVRQRPLFTVGVLSLAAGLAMLRDPEPAERAIAAISAERETLAGALRGIGLDPLSSAGNFLSFDAAPLGPEPVARLADQGVAVAAFPWDGATFLRATIGTAGDSEALITALKALM